MEKVLQLWLLRILRLLTSAWFTTITKLLCLLNKIFFCRKSHWQDKHKLRNTRTIISSLYEYCKALSSDGIYFGKDISQPCLTYTQRQTSNNYNWMLLLKQKQKYHSDIRKQLWITTRMSFQEMKQNYWGTSYLQQNSELNWKYHTRWKCRSCNSQNWNRWQHVSVTYFSVHRPWLIRMTILLPTKINCRFHQDISSFKGSWFLNIDLL